MTNLLSFLHYCPRPEFLADIVTFEGVMVAVAMPLGYEIVTRISERYESDVISKQFAKSIYPKMLLLWPLSNLLLCIILQFSYVGKCTIWGYATWLALISFLPPVCLFIRFVHTVYKYTTQTEYILKEFFNVMDQTLR